MSWQNLFVIGEWLSMTAKEPEKAVQFIAVTIKIVCEFF